MLTYMRKNAGSWIVKIIFTVIVLVFIFFYGFSGQKDDRKDLVLASVGTSTIPLSAYMTAYKNTLQFYRSMYKDQFSEDIIEKLGVKQQVLEDMINRELLLQEAENMDIMVSEQEVKQAILTTPTFQENGVFSQKLYQRVLSYYGISATEYEKDKEREIKLKLLENMIKSSANVSEREVRDFYNLQNEKVKTAYLVFTPETIQDTIKVTDEEIQAYYEKNKEDFMVPEKIKVQYITFDPKRFEQRTEVTDEEIEEYYAIDQERFFEQQKVKARHILLKVDKNAPSEKVEAVKTKARALADRIRAGESFDDLARQYSEDAASAQKGGDLGYFSRGTMVKEFENKAFSMQAGQVSEPVQTQYGYHIIRVDAVQAERVKPLEEVKATLEAEIRQEKAQELVRKEAKRAFNRLFKSGDLEGYARKNDVPVETTPYFAFGKALEDKPDNDSFSKQAFALSPGDLAPAFAVEQKYILLKLLDRQESHVPPLDEVKSDVLLEVKKSKSVQAAKAKAESALEQLRRGTQQWAELTKQQGLEQKEVELTRMGDFIAGIGTSAPLKQAAFRLDVTAPYPETVFQTKRGTFLIKFVEKKGADETMFEKNREATTQNVLQRKRNELFNQFLQELKARATIEVNTDIFSTV